MPLETVIGLIAIFAMFGSFIVSLGGVTLWLALSDRRNPAQARAAVDAPQIELPEMRRAA